MPLPGSHPAPPTGHGTWPKPAITVGTADGTKLQVGGSIEEGEARSDNVWSGKMQLNIPLK
jgi:hypothetical protein